MEQKIEKKQYNSFNAVLMDLNADDKGHYYICDCPECKQHEAFIYKNNTNYLQCNRENECGESFILEYMTKDKTVHKEEKKELTLNEMQKKEIDMIDRVIQVMQERGRSSLIATGYRGLSEETLRQFMADMQVEDGVKAIFEQGKNIFPEKYANSSFITKRNLIFPIYGEDGGLERMVMRSSSDKNLKPKEIQVIVNPSKEARDFFVDVPDGAKTIVITESILDGMSFREVNKDIGVLALTGAKKTKQLNQFLLKNDALLQGKNIILALDNDKAGHQASEKIGDVLDLMDKKYQQFYHPMYVKDANEYLNTNRKMFEGQVYVMTLSERNFEDKKEAKKGKKQDLVLERG